MIWSCHFPFRGAALARIAAVSFAPAEVPLVQNGMDRADLEQCREDVVLTSLWVRANGENRFASFKRVCAPAATAER